MRATKLSSFRCGMLFSLMKTLFFVSPPSNHCCNMTYLVFYVALVMVVNAKDTVEQMSTDSDAACEFLRSMPSVWLDASAEIALMPLGR